MKPFLFVQVLFVLCMLIPRLTFSQSKQGAFTKTSCFLDNCDWVKERNIEWGYLTVPENRTIAESRKLKLAVAIIKSHSLTPKKDPVLYLDGGPGGSAIHKLWFWLDHPILAERDIILIDQRGTGYSEPNFCPELGDSLLHLLSKNVSQNEFIKGMQMAAQKCRNSLVEKGIDLYSYNSNEMTRDILDLKNQLAIKEWNIIGVSYGTRVALTLLQQQSEGIRSLILDSTVPLSKPYFDQITGNLHQAIEALVSSCESDESCRQNFPDLGKDIQDIIESYKKNPLTLSIDDARLVDRKFVMNEMDVILCLHQSLYNSMLIQILPNVIEQFKKRNEKFLSTFVRTFVDQIYALDYGTYYCVMCNETMPYNSLAKFERDAQRYPYLSGGLANYKAEYKICSLWGNAVVDSSSQVEMVTPISTLILAGQFDPITPASNGIYLRERFTNSHLLTVPRGGHALTFDPDNKVLVSSFINDPSETPVIDRNASKEFITDINAHAGIANVAFGFLDDPQPLDMLALLLAVLGFVQFIIIWPTRFLINKLFRKNGTSLIDRKVVYLLTFTSLAGVGFIISFAIMLTNIAAQNIYILTLGFPTNYSSLFLLPHLIMVCFVALIVLLIRSWRYEGWTLIRKIQACCVLVACVCFIYFTGNFGLFLI